MERHLSFGYWVRRWRKALDLTQVALAQRVGCAEATIRKIEADERRPSQQMAERLAEQLALAPEERAAFLKAARAELAADQLAVPATPVVQAALSPPPPRSRNLPIPLTPLIGRANELAAVCTHLQREDVRLLTLLGAGGTGKTRLALEVAGELETEFADGVCFVDLAPIRDPALVASAIAQTLDVVEVAGQPLRESLTTHLRTKQALLVLDNFEQVLAAALLVTELLASCPNVKVLVTSRAVLRVSGEHHYVVPPLDVPAATEHDPRSVAQCAAVRLFVARAQAVKPEFTLSAANAGAVAEICRRLDGLPLALELAAARSKLFSPPALLARLAGTNRDSPFRLLSGGPVDQHPKHRTLRATIEWSYLLLGEGERALLRRLGGFVGGWTLEAAEAVCSLEGELDVLEGMAALVDHSLVQAAEGANGEPRFTMLETIREYALEQLELRGEAETTQRAHAAYYVALAEAAERQLHRAEQLFWLARLETEHDNLRAALAWAQERDTELGLRLAGALWRFWFIQGYLSEGRAWLDGMLTKGSATTVPLRAKVLTGAGMLAYYQGDYAQAAALGEAGLTLAEAAADTPSRAVASLILGFVAGRQGDVRQATALLEESLRLAQEFGDSLIITLALVNLAGSASIQGDLARATALLGECHTLARRLGDRWSLALGLAALGSIALEQSKYGQAAAHFEEALDLWRALGAKSAIADTLTGLGWTALLQGEYGAARARFAESLAIYQEVGNKRGIAEALKNLGVVARDQGDFEQAAAYSKEALAMWREVGAKATVAGVLIDLGLVARFQGDLRRAVAYSEEGLALFQALENQGGLAWARISLGRVMHDLGDVGRAAALYRESLAFFRNMGHQRAIAECLEWLGRVAALGQHAEDIHRAARLWGAAQTLREAIDAPLPPVDRIEYEQAVTTAHLHLDKPAFTAAWAAGQAMSLEQAVAYALAEDTESRAVGEP